MSASSDQQNFSPAQSEDRSFWTDLASVVMRPRRTIRRIIDTEPDRYLKSIFLLAIFSAALEDFDLQGFREVEMSSPLLLAINVVAGIALGLLFMLLAYYVLAGSATLVGRWLGGNGRFRDVRAAIAWGLVPFIWALTYRLPAAVISLVTERQLGPRLLIDDGRVEWREGMLATLDTGWFLLFVLLDLAVLVWYLIIASRTLAEAHRVSSWNGAVTLILAFIFPFASIATLAFVTWVYVGRVG